MHFIFARGQDTSTGFSHQPASALEAQNMTAFTDFYIPNDLRYHGSSSANRGVVRINFFEEKNDDAALQPPCVGEWRAPANCAAEACRYIARWYVECNFSRPFFSGFFFCSMNALDRVKTTLHIEIFHLNHIDYYCYHLSPGKYFFENVKKNFKLFFKYLFESLTANFSFKFEYMSAEKKQISSLVYSYLRKKYIQTNNQSMGYNTKTCLNYSLSVLYYILFVCL